MMISHLSLKFETLCWRNVCSVLTLILAGFANGTPDSVKDVVEGDDVVLQCRFSPALADSSATLYWIRYHTFKITLLIHLSNI